MQFESKHGKSCVAETPETIKQQPMNAADIHWSISWQVVFDEVGKTNWTVPEKKHDVSIFFGDPPVNSEVYLPPFAGHVPKETHRLSPGTTIACHLRKPRDQLPCGSQTGAQMGDTDVCMLSTSPHRIIFRIQLLMGVNIIPNSSMLLGFNLC